MALNDELPNKRIKLDNSCKNESNGTENNKQNISFKDFEIVKILSNNPDQRLVAVEGKISNQEGRAVVVLQKSPFNEEELPQVLSGSTELKLLFNNDVYYKETAFLPPQLNGVQASIIFPADEKHVQKYTTQPIYFIEETPELYKDVTLPYIQNLSYSLQWVYNILEHKKEADRIVCEDLDPENGFVLVPDMKWDGTKENLYLLAIVMKRDLSSIRDLTDQHIPLLENILSKCTKTIKEKYDYNKEQLRIYFHYQPTFYHLHIHFNIVSVEAPGIKVGKAILLSTVINNLKIDSNYYKKSTLTYSLPKNHLLCTKFEEHGYFKEENNCVQ